MNWSFYDDSEYQFKNTNTKNRDALTRFSEQITTTAYESRNAFALLHKVL